MATRMSSFPGPSGYVLVPLRDGVDFTLYRGRQHGNPSSVLAIVLSAEQPSLQSLRRLEHEYSLAVELDPAWAAKPLALTRHETRQWIADTAERKFKVLRRIGHRSFRQLQDAVAEGEEKVTEVLRNGKKALESVAAELD